MGWYEIEVSSFNLREIVWRSYANQNFSFFF